MEVGPPGTGCRTSLQTTGRCVGIRSQVVSGSGKGGAGLRQVRIMKTNESEPLMRRRKNGNVIETKARCRPWDKARKGAAYGPGGDRRIGGVSLIQAFMRNMGTWRFDAKGETQGDGSPRVRVPKRNAGADQLVIVMKPGNAGGAKGLDRPAKEVCQPARGGAHVRSKTV